MYDLLSSVLNKPEPDEAEDKRTDEEIAADLKRDRIKFHRESVRNGPVKWKSMTSGQVRRAQKRAAKRAQKNTYRAQVRNYLETRRLASVTAAKLRQAGALPYVHERELDRIQQVYATVWIVQRFGVEDDDGVVSFAKDDV